MSTYIDISDPVISEGSKFVDFVLTLSAASANTISVSYNTSNNSTSYNDYTSTNGTVQFAPGVTTQTVRVALTDDTAVEAIESFQLALSNPMNAVLTRPAGTALLVDNDTAADSSHPATLSIRDLTVDESAGSATFTVLLDKAVSGSFALEYHSTDGIATAGSDYTAVSGTLNFAPGETAKTITVPITNDTAAEANEYFSVQLGAISSSGSSTLREVQMGDDVALATIIHNDQTPVAMPVISVNSVAAGEGDGYVDFVVTLSGPGVSEVSVNYSTSNDTTNYNDYASASGKLVFAPGVTSQVVRVALFDDKVTESSEILKLYLSSAVNANISSSGASALILDNDTQADSIQAASLVVRNVTVDESAGAATFVVTLDKAVSDTFSVGYSSANGNASAGSDYGAVSGALIFAPGETAKTITVPIFNDSAAEAVETFLLNLGSISGKGASSVRIAEGTAQATIGANDQTPLAKPVIMATDTVAGEGDGYIDFVVSLSAPSTSTVSVSYSTGNDTSSYSDYASTSGILTFAPGVTTQVVRVALVDDQQTESREVLSLNLSSAVNAILGKSSASGTLFDNDSLADTTHQASASVRDVTVDESNGVVTFVVALDKATTNPFNIAYSTANGNARDGSDFVGTHGILSFAAGETVHTVTVLLNDDTTPEAAEQFYLNLGVVSGKGADQVLVAQATGTAVIGASDQTAAASPVISVANVTAGEGQGYADFVVSLSAPSTNQVSVNYSTANGSTSYSDYAADSGTLVFAPGVTTQTVRVALVDDILTEGPEMLKLVLNSPVNATISSGNGSLLIVDNDRLADSVNPAGLTVHDVSVDESTDTVSFVVTLDKASSDSFNVTYATGNGSAVAGSDYAARAGTLTFSAGETAKTVTVPLINDSTPEADETFSLQLGAVSGKAANAVTLAHASGIATIVHNDLPPLASPALSVSNPTAGEADGYVDFVVSLNAPSTSTVSVNYSTGNNTTSYSDYAAASGTLVFAPGVTSQVVRVALTDDNLTEPTETFHLSLSSPVNATLASGSGTSGTASIVDNDTLADTVNRANLTVQDVTVNEAAGTATFALVLSKAVSAAFSVTWNTLDGSATAGSDYQAGSGSVGFAAGDTLKLVTVNLINDPWVESSETFQLQLGALSGSGAANVTLGNSNATATLNSDDASTPAATLTLNTSAATVSEGNPVTFNLNSTGLAAGSQVGYVLSGIDASRLEQPLNGVLSIDSNGVASLKLDVLENGKTDAPSTLKLTLLGTPTAVSAQTAVTDAAVLKGTAGNDQLKSTAANDKLDGGAGLDTMTYSGVSTNFDIRKTANGYLVTDATGANGSDLLQNVERLSFSDKALALDIDGIGGQVYRVYQAAFDRAPDLAGLGYWISQMDKGLSLNTVAAGFVNSAEFAQLNGGASASNAAFLSKLYSNVLHRVPDQAGYDYWLGIMNNAGISKAEVLASFSESAENQAQVIGTIQNGFEYIPFG